MATQQELLLLKIEAQGDEQLTSIARQLVDIGNSGGEAAPKAQALLEEMGKLADTATKASGLAPLKAQLQETGDALFFAKQKAAELQAQFDSTAAPTATLTRQLDRANASVTQLDTKYNSLTAAVTANENALRAEGVNLDLLDAEQRRLQTAMDGTRVKATQLATAHAQNSAAAKEEAVSVETLSQKYGLFGKVVESVKTLLATFAGLFALEKAKEQIGEILATGDKFAKFRDDFGDLFGGAEKGADALERVKEIAEQTPLSLDAVAAAALKAKKEGLDPFDGTLQALIDANAKFGGGQEILTDLIEKLGRAYNKGALSGKELLGLQQAGIPVTQLLGQAMGKTADEIEDLANKGQLGRESIKLLIDQIGKSAAGNAADEMNTLSALTTKVKDGWEEFLNLIAKSGVYDFVAQKLRGVADALKQGLADGTLKEKAQAIANAIVNIGNGAAAAAKFVYDHATAIYEAAKAYVIFRTALLALDLAGAAAKMLTLATATREAAIAAETAAAESGAFGKLGAVLGRIPRGIQIAVAAVGIVELLGQASELIDGLKKLREVNQLIADTDAERARQLTILASKAETVAQRLASFAQTQIADADALAAKNRAQSDTYIEQLQNATRYYEALRIQAQAIGDQNGAAAAGAKLRELGIALEEARKHAADLAEQMTRTDDAVNTVVNRFDALTTAGEKAAVAVSNAFDKIELHTPQGLNDALAIIQQVSIRSRDAKVAIQTELGGALEKLNDADLRSFQRNVSDILAQAGKNADAAKIALGSALQEELIRLGLTAEQAGAKFTASGQKIIATFSDIAHNALASGDQIQLAFAKALDQAQTQGEVEALKQQLQGAFDAGKLSASQFEAGMQATGRKLADIQIGAAKAGAALDGMGRDGVTAAERISSALQDTRDALVVQANQMAAAINVALLAGDNAKADALRAQFRSVEEQIASLTAQIDELTPAYNAAGDAAESAGHRMEAAATGAAEANDAAAASTEDFATRGIGSLNELTGYMANTRAGFLQISDAAAKAFATRVLQDFNTEFDSTGIGFARVIAAIGDAAKQTNDELANNRSELLGMIQNLEQFGDSSQRNFGGFGRTIGEADRRMGALSAQIANGTFQIGILGREELGPLQAALDAARQRVQALAAAERQAADELRSLNAQLLDERDQQLNNQQAIEDRRYQGQIEQIKALAAQAGTAGSQQAAEDLRLADEIHQRKLADIKAEQQAQAQSRQQQQITNAQQQQPLNLPPLPAPAASLGSGNVRVDLNVNVGGSVSSLDDAALRQKVMEILQGALPDITHQIIQVLIREKGRT